MKKRYIFGGSLIAGLALAAGINVGAALERQNIEDEMFHVEQFEVTVYEDYSLRGEPVDGTGEGIAFGTEIAAEYIVKEKLDTGDVVNVYWTQAQAEKSDWLTPAKMEAE